MSNLFYSTSLWRAGPLGWATRKASFAERPIEADIHLTSFSVQSGERFDPYQPHYAHAYVITPQTPTMTFGAVSVPKPNKLTDTTVWLTAGTVTFELQSDGVTAAAAAFIRDVDPAPKLQSKLVSKLLRRLDLALYDEDGSVVGTHSEIQLDGGADFDDDELYEHQMAVAQARTGRVIDIAPIDTDMLSAGVAFRIDPRSRRAEPFDGHLAGAAL